MPALVVVKYTTWILCLCHTNLNILSLNFTVHFLLFCLPNHIILKNKKSSLSSCKLQYKMSTLGETIMKTSRVAAFILESLAFKSYPNCLYWMDEANSTFVLHCIHRRKDGWSQEVQSIFLDYDKFKIRKSVAGDRDKRSVFLQAIIASPYIEIIKELSTADKKVCKFTNKFKDFTNSLMGDVSLPAVGNNIAASTDIPFEVVIPEDSVLMDNFYETFTFLGLPSPESNGELAPTLGRSSASCNGSSHVANYPENPNGFQYSLAHSNGEHTFVPNIPQQALVTSMETESAVPCIRLTETDDNQSSLYATYNESINLGENPQPVAYDTNEGYGEPGDTQLSFPLDEFPSDYDPVLDLIRSQEQNSAGNQQDLYQGTQSTTCEILSIHSIEIVGNRVHVLDRVEMNSTFSPGSSKYYMLKIKDASERQ